MELHLSLLVQAVAVDIALVDSAVVKLPEKDRLVATQEHKLQVALAIWAKMDATSTAVMETAEVNKLIGETKWTDQEVEPATSVVKAVTLMPEPVEEDQVTVIPCTANPSRP